jgi:CRISPR system Cascade subunit CasD
MPEVLLIRLDAPLISFGGPAVDNYRVVQPMPALSMLAGLFANALGFDHRDFDKTQRLQERLRFAARRDRPGTELRDYQTVDLGQDHLRPELAGWTTWGRVEQRDGASSDQTHIRYRDYIADAVYTVAVGLEPETEQPTLAALADALEAPARPLFIGRKCCLPAAPLLVGLRVAPSVLQALLDLPRLPRRRTGLQDGEPLAAWWPEGDAEGEAVEGVRTIPVTDTRDWGNQVHCGRRLIRHGLLTVATEVRDE